MLGENRMQSFGDEEEPPKKKKKKEKKKEKGDSIMVDESDTDPFKSPEDHLKKKKKTKSKKEDLEENHEFGISASDSENQDRQTKEKIAKKTDAIDRNPAIYRR